MTHLCTTDCKTTGNNQRKQQSCGCRRWGAKQKKQQNASIARGDACAQQQLREQHLRAQPGVAASVLQPCHGLHAARQPCSQHKPFGAFGKLDAACG